ncbi:MAG: gliding motility protein GldN [Dysgonomonas sp.]
MKYIVSLIFSGLLLSSSLMAQNLVRDGWILDQKDVVEPIITAEDSTIEDQITNIGTRELAVMESSMNDYSSTIWSKDIYRQIGRDVVENETFFVPLKSTEYEANLFSLMINLISRNSIGIYKYNSQPETDEQYILEGKDALEECAIPYSVNSDGSFSVKKEDIPSDKITYYLVKEKWYFDSKTSKGDIRVTDICPVLFEKGKYFPLFWVSFDDISVYLARTESSVIFTKTEPASTNASMFDVIGNRYYRGCIYQVGLRQLSLYFPDMKDLINERRRIENELDYIQSKFYAVARKHKE